MRFLRILFVMLPVLILCGCFEYDLTGDAYIVKGAGDIKPVAGQKVFLLPYENEIDFLHEAATSAYGVASSQMTSELDPLCKRGLEIAGNKKEKLNEELTKLKNKNTVPQGGCASLQSSIDTLSQKTETIKKDYEGKLSQLNSKLASLQKSKNEKVKKDANSLQKKIESKVKIKLMNQGGYSGYDYEYTVINETDYCVSIKSVEVFSKNHSINRETGFYENRKDKYGFDTGCDVLPQTNRNYKDMIILAKIDSPEEKMLLEDGKILRYKNTDYPKITNISIDYKLTNMTSKKDGSKVNYNHSDVSYSDLAEKNNKYSEDSEISEVKKNISGLKNQHESNQDIKELISLEKNLSECRGDEEKISATETILSEFENIISSTSSCGKNGNVASAVSAIETLNKNHGAKIELPDIQESYTKETLVVLANKMGESLQAKTTIQGAYEFKKLKKGKYLLYTEYSDNFNSGFWMKPIEISDNMKVDLTNDEMVFAPFTDYVNIQLQSACKSCGLDEFKKTLKSRPEVVETYKERKKMLEQLIDALRDLQRKLY